jgi:structural maintenance of chromosomes protein 5
MNQTESVAELEAHLEEEQNTLRANQQQNTVGVLEAYEKRAKDIAEIEERMANRQGLIDGTNREIAEKRQIWEPRLERLVRRVSAAFADAFESIGCAGEVLLSKSGEEGKPDTDDFEKWQLHIKVKFRQQEKLQQLTGQRQSGGERSVSTIFFLMALQEMARAPFRVVDEINQGMDPKNERLVHKRMVEAACRDGTSQYVPLPVLLT